MSARLLVDNLIRQVRSLLDENNSEQVNDVADILPALNRAQDHASSILSRRYESPMLATQEVTLVDGQSDYPIPEDAFEQRLEKVELKINTLYHELMRIDYRQVTNIEVGYTTAIPQYYCIVGNQYRILPAPTGTYPLRLWYLQDPPPLAISQGRITQINVVNNYVVVDTVGSDLEVIQDSLNSVVNIVDGQTGKIKVTLQIQSITGQRITFKSVPAIAYIDHLEVKDEIPDTVQKGDYIVVAPGSCISFFKKPFSNFLIQYAVADLQRKLGGNSELEQRLLDELKRDVERSWAGREQYLTVKNKQSKWFRPRSRV